MITVVETLKSIPGKEKDLKKALQELVPISRKAKGCLQYDLLESVEEKEEFLILMCFETVEDLRAHESSEYIAKFEKQYDRVLYDEVQVSEWQEIPGSNDTR